MIQADSPPIFIYTALACEAKALIGHFKLKKDLGITAFAIYRRDNMYLTVTGLGKNAMAAGIAYSQALFAGNSPVILLNVGIAGHPDADLGGLYLVDKCIDKESRKRHYPPLVFKPPCPTMCLQSSVLPQLDYQEACLYDMEASAFYETAVRFTTAELAHSLKIISDNCLAPAENIQAKQVTELISAQLPGIQALILELGKLAAGLSKSEPASFQALLQQYHCTATEQLQLKSLLRRWAVLTAEAVPEFAGTSSQRGKDLIRWLEQQIMQLDFYL